MVNVPVPPEELPQEETTETVPAMMMTVKIETKIAFM